MWNVFLEALVAAPIVRQTTLFGWFLGASFSHFRRAFTRYVDHTHTTMWFSVLSVSGIRYLVAIFRIVRTGYKFHFVSKSVKRKCDKCDWRENATQFEIRQRAGSHRVVNSHATGNQRPTLYCQKCFRTLSKAEEQIQIHAECWYFMGCWRLTGVLLPDLKRVMKFGTGFAYLVPATNRYTTLEEASAHKSAKSHAGNVFLWLVTLTF